MNRKDIISLRLHNLRLTNSDIKDPGALAAWLCGIQAQDYSQVKWAIGCRLPGYTITDIEKAFSQQKIIRTWLMRGTIHVVSPGDIHWLNGLSVAVTKSVVRIVSVPRI